MSTTQGSYSVHVHTDDAGAAVEAGLVAGRLSRIVISVLSSGATGLPVGSWTRERAVLAVVDGDGAAALFAGEGACVLQRGRDVLDPSIDISAHRLVRAVVETGAAQVMVFGEIAQFIAQVREPRKRGEFIRGDVDDGRHVETSRRTGDQ